MTPELSRARDRWLAAPFPSGSSNDEIDEIHADLVLIDTWVAGTIEPYAAGREWSPAVPDVLGTIAHMRAQLHAVSTSGDEILIVRAYEDYLTLLETAYSAFLKNAPESY